MDSPPLISIIIPNYNRGDLLPETLDSLLRQDFSSWEALIVDDGSTDDSVAVALRYANADKRFRLIRREREPRGAPTCRNEGLHASAGAYVIFLDSDDLLTQEALAQRAETIHSHPEFDFWVFPILMFRDDPSKADRLWNIDNGEPDLHRFLILDAPWQTTGPIWRKESVVRIGGFTEGMACWQDVDFHLKALIAGLKGRKFYDLPPDVLYRQHETQSISQGEISSPGKLKSRFEMFKRHVLALKQHGFSMGLSKQQTLADLLLLGGNIAIGAARALNKDICAAVVRFGASEGIFPPSVTRQLLMIMAFYQFRLNKIPFINRKIMMKTAAFRQDSNIGKHLFTK